MIRKKLIFGLVAAVLALTQLPDCMAMMTRNQPSMKCCRTLQCTRFSQSQDCCTTMASEQIPGALPAAQVSVDPMAVLLVELQVPFNVGQKPLSRNVVEGLQHSPPALYTLHASLLI